jgi:hypothetical protein
MRTLSTSVMALLIVAALFWGNCFSCPQLLVAAQKHGCCPHSTKSAKTECQTPGLKNFVKAEKSAPAAITVVAAVELPAPASEFAAPLAVPHLETHAPPDNLPLRI